MTILKKLFSIVIVVFIAGGIYYVSEINVVANLGKSVFTFRQHDDSIGSILMASYPDWIIGYDSVYIYWKDSTKMKIDDDLTGKTLEEIISNPDLKDQFYFDYPSGLEFDIPKKDFDPGRIRNEAFFKKMYGSREEDVERNLREVVWLPESLNTKLLVTRVNGVSEQLQKVSDILDKKPHLHKYLTNPGGTFKWRRIAGTSRLSTHSFGISIDINTNYSNYWRWDVDDTEGGNIPYQNKIPLEIVAIFEEYGFIWGGKWYHYDTMHFEYRPELLSH